jgi:hypothetical protein
VKKCILSFGDSLGSIMKLHEFKLAQLQVIQAECLEKLDIPENYQVQLF